MVETKSLPPSPEFGEAPQYPIESVDNALRVLLLFSEQSQLRLTDVSRYLDVASSTAHRVLAMLQFRGYVKQDATTRSYHPGPSLDALAFGILRRLDVRIKARPVLERLNMELQETVHLGRLEGADVHFIDSIESARALRVGSRLGRSMPAHCTSTGKALLAGLSETELRSLYPNQRLEPMTAHSITSRNQLRKELAAIRQRGFALSSEESEDGVSSAAVALRGTTMPRLAINASVPVNRMTASIQKHIVEQLFAAAEEIELLLP